MLDKNPFRPVPQNPKDSAPILQDSSVVETSDFASAYVSNRATGDTLPGLSIARDVSHFHDAISAIKSLDEAKGRKTTHCYGCGGGLTRDFATHAMLNTIV